MANKLHRQYPLSLHVIQPVLFLWWRALKSYEVKLIGLFRFDQSGLSYLYFLTKLYLTIAICCTMQKYISFLFAKGPKIKGAIRYIESQNVHYKLCVL